jgi:hypothetical protein
VTASTD